MSIVTDFSSSLYPSSFYLSFSFSFYSIILCHRYKCKTNRFRLPNKCIYISISLSLPHTNTHTHNIFCSFMFVFQYISVVSFPQIHIVMCGDDIIRMTKQQQSCQHYHDCNLARKNKLRVVMRKVESRLLWRVKNEMCVHSGFVFFLQKCFRMKFYIIQAKEHLCIQYITRCCII